MDYGMSSLIGAVLKLELFLEKLFAGKFVYM